MFVFQAAVKAAINGRILILDGIEKAERNVLPVLNNLLENREMPLEDGRLLISSSRFDKLLEVVFLFRSIHKNVYYFLIIRRIKHMIWRNGSSFVWMTSLE